MKNALLILFTIMGLAVMPAALANGPVYAAPSCGTSTDAKGQVLGGIGQTGSSCDDTPINNALATIIEIVSIIAGAVAIIMIIYSGFKYITSGGDAAKISAAKNTLIYALVGIVIVVLAQLIVRFVITQSEAAATNKCASNINIQADDPRCRP